MQKELLLKRYRQYEVPSDMLNREKEFAKLLLEKSSSPPILLRHLSCEESPKRSPSRINGIGSSILQSAERNDLSFDSSDLHIEESIKKTPDFPQPDGLLKLNSHFGLPLGAKLLFLVKADNRSLEGPFSTLEMIDKVNCKLVSPQSKLRLIDVFEASHHFSLADCIKADFAEKVKFSRMFQFLNKKEEEAVSERIQETLNLDDIEDLKRLNKVSKQQVVSFSIKNVYAPVSSRESVAKREDSKEKKKNETKNDVDWEEIKIKQKKTTKLNQIVGLSMRVTAEEPKKHAKQSTEPLKGLKVINEIGKREGVKLNEKQRKVSNDEGFEDVVVRGKPKMVRNK